MITIELKRSIVKLSAMSHQLKAWSSGAVEDPTARESESDGSPFEFCA